MKNSVKLLLLVLCLSAIMTSFALAANVKTYTLDDLYMQISVPEGLAVFTRDISDDDPNLAALGLQKQSLQKLYNDNSIYLNAIAMDISHELVITKTTNEDVQKIFNFNLYNDDKIFETETSLREEYSKIGYDVTSFTTYQGPTAKYVILDFTQLVNGVTVYSRQFYTIYNGLAINITLHSYSGEVTSELGNELQGVVDSVVFTETLPTPDGTLALQKGNIFTSYLMVWIVGAAGCGIIALIVILLVKKKNKKKALNTVSNSNDSSNIQP